MMKHFLQLLGAVCLTVGAVLFFTLDSSNLQHSTSAEKDEEINRLSKELAAVKEALADAQQPKKTEIAETKEEENTTTESNETSEKDSVIKMILTISTGDTSRDASDSLEEAGIIKSATEFEGYLNKQQLSGKIQIGKHAVDSDMSFAELAKELTTVKQ